MYESEVLELSATLTGKNLVIVIARAQIRSEESMMMMTRYFSKTEAMSRVMIVTAGLFIHLGGPLSFI